jgi:hypothetical protein
MVPVERPKTNEKFASREKILKWKTGLKALNGKAFTLNKTTKNYVVEWNFQAVSVL